MMKRTTVMLTGDIMCQPGLTELCTAPDGKRDYTKTIGALREAFSAPDLLIGNLETPIAGEAFSFTHERYCFNSPDEFAQMLKDDGFDLVCLANNHCMDRGEAGIDATLDTLDRIGLPHTGIYRNASERVPTVLTANGIRVGIVNYTYGTNAFAHHTFLSEKNSPRVNLFQPEETLPGSVHLLESMEDIAEKTEALYERQNPLYDTEIAPHLARLEQDIADTKAVSDFVIVVMHSGGQYNPMPDAYTRKVAENLRKMGADCIVGHHPHVIHPSVFEDGVFCAYSLGNFYCTPSGAHEPLPASYSALLTLTLEQDENGTRLAHGDFILAKTMEEQGKAPYVVYASDSGAPEEEQLFYARKFAGKPYETIQKSYPIF